MRGTQKRPEPARGARLGRKRAEQAAALRRIRGARSDEAQVTDRRCGAPYGRAVRGITDAAQLGDERGLREGHPLESKKRGGEIVVEPLGVIAHAQLIAERRPGNHARVELDWRVLDELEKRTQLVD